MGKKIGIAGPDRGAGAPRFTLETPMLGLLVESTLTIGERLSYEDWIDRVYERFGLILTSGRDSRARDLLKKLESPGAIHQALESNREALRRRLVRAGLAAEYSDAETEVFRSDELE